MLTLSACTRSKEDPPLPPTADTMYLSSIATDTDSIAYTYNNDKTLKQSDYFNTSQTTFIPMYTDGKLSAYERINTVNGVSTRNRVANILLNEKGQVVKITAPPTSMDKLYDSLIYNSAGQLIIYYTYRQPGDVTPLRQYILTWENNNLVKILYDNPSANVKTTWTYTYDDKPNLYASIRVLGHLSTSQVYYFSANNITQEKEVSENGTTITDDYKYKYNNDGYPVESIKTTTFNGTSTDYNYRYHY